MRIAGLEFNTDSPLANNTVAAYTEAAAGFWRDMQLSGGTPASREHLMNWLRPRIEDGTISPSRATVVCVAVDWRNRQMGAPPVFSNSDDISNAIANFKRQVAVLRSGKDSAALPRSLADNAAPPMTPKDFNRIQTKMPLASKTWTAPRDLALIALMFAGALRASEAALLREEDVNLDRARRDGVEIFLARSKGDQLASGKRIYAANLDFMRRSVFDEMDRWLGRRRTMIKNGEIPIRKAQTLGDSLFLFPNRVALMMTLKNRLRAIFGDDTPYSSHSFRAGYATYAAASGAPLADVQKHMRHSLPGTTAVYYRGAAAGEVGRKIADTVNGVGGRRT